MFEHYYLINHYFYYRMVSSYLVHHGYSSTAETFAKTTNQNFCEEIASIKNRQSKFNARRTAEQYIDRFHLTKKLRTRFFVSEILKLVMSGRMGLAIEQTLRSYPGLLERNQNLLFMLKCRQFVEMVNGSDFEVS